MTQEYCNLKKKPISGSGYHLPRIFSSNIQLRHPLGMTHLANCAFSTEYCLRPFTLLQLLSPANHSYSSPFPLSKPVFLSCVIKNGCLSVFLKRIKSSFCFSLFLHFLLIVSTKMSSKNHFKDCWNILERLQNVYSKLWLIHVSLLMMFRTNVLYFIMNDYLKLQVEIILQILSHLCGNTFHYCSSQNKSSSENIIIPFEAIDVFLTF